MRRPLRVQAWARLGSPKSDTVRLCGLEELAGARAGLAIGLFGGSFNPAHEGHRHVALTALRTLNLDRIWWIVSPLNPLKAADGMGHFEDRFASAVRMAVHPHMAVSRVEHILGLRYSADTVEVLQHLFPLARFVWIMGGDSFHQFDRWGRWRELAAKVPIAVVARPGLPLGGRIGRAGSLLAKSEVNQGHRLWLSEFRAPAWAFLDGPRNPASATQIRASLSAPW